MYDISSNRTRLRVSQYCKKAGLIRLQKSVFVGKGPPQIFQELEKDVRLLLAKNDRFVVVPIKKGYFNTMIQQSPPDDRLLALMRNTAFWGF
jgi:CRISPR-associated endonuclease Cas2